MNIEDHTLCIVDYNIMCYACGSVVINICLYFSAWHAFNEVLLYMQSEHNDITCPSRRSGLIYPT